MHSHSTTCQVYLPVFQPIYQLTHSLTQTLITRHTINTPPPHFSPSSLAKAMNEVLAPEGALAKQLTYLEKMHPGDGPYFNNQVN